MPFIIANTPRILSFSSKWFSAQNIVLESQLSELFFFHTHRHSHKSSRQQNLYCISREDNVAGDWFSYLFQAMQVCLFLQLSLEYGYKSMPPSARNTI